jgi:hypothetical protein
MSTTPDPRIDIVTVATAMVATFASGEIAGYLGPYIVIAAAGMVGAVAAVMRHPDQMGRWRALGMVALLTALAVLTTGSVAYLIEAVASHAGWLVPSRYTLVPVALAIAGVGHDWPAVAAWAVGLLRRRAERKLGDQ